MLSKIQASHYPQFTDLCIQHSSCNGSSYHIHPVSTLRKPNLHLHMENKDSSISHYTKHSCSSYPSYTTDKSSCYFATHPSCPLPSPPLTRDTFFRAQSPTSNLVSSPNNDMKPWESNELSEPKESNNNNNSSILPRILAPLPNSHLAESHFTSSNSHFESLKLNPPREMSSSEDLPTLPSFSSLELSLFPPNNSSTLPFSQTPSSLQKCKLHSPPSCPRRPLSMFQLPTVSSFSPPHPPPLPRSRSSTNTTHFEQGSFNNSIDSPHSRSDFLASPLSTLLYAAKEISSLEKLNNPASSPTLAESTASIESSLLSSSSGSSSQYFDSPAISETFCPSSSPFTNYSSSDSSHSSYSSCNFSTLSSTTSQSESTPSPYASPNALPSNSTKVLPSTSSPSTKRNKEFPCPNCGKLFSRAYNLKSHMKTHTSERPFQCDHCSKAFARKQDCLRHMRIHTNDRPFVCHHCATSFSRQDALSRHEYTCFGARSLYSGASSSGPTAVYKSPTPSSEGHCLSDSFPLPSRSSSKALFQSNTQRSNDSGVYSE